MWMKRTYFLLIVFILLIIAPSVNASITVTVTAPSSVTQGSNIPILASFVAGQDGDSGTFYFSCDQTVSGEVDPQSGYSIVSSSSKTYTFTPNTAQTYSNCKVSDGGSQYSSTFAVNVVAPTTLTVSGSPSSTTNNSGDTFSLAISITNPAASAVTTSYSLGCSSHTCIGDQTSDTISISAGATTTLQWTVTAGSSSGNITFQLGSNSNAFTSSVTVPSTTTTTVSSSSTGGGGGGGGGTTTEKKKSKTWDKITPGSAEIMHVDDPDIGLKMINITVKNPAQTVTITVTKLAGKPASVVHEISGKVYKYMEIKGDNINETHIDKVKIQFQVNKSWVSSNNINRATIALNRYKNNNWEKLTTKEVSEDNDYVYYEAETPGFSTFAVTGEEVTTTVATTVVATTVATTRVTTTIPTNIPSELGGVPTWIAVLIILIVVIVILGLVFGRGKSKTREKDIREKFTLTEF
jgi:PGF-pre-PGF domain-containing protein